ncbi:hypothetical protein C0L75_03250 [Clostridium perfringens]
MVVFLKKSCKVRHSKISSIVCTKQAVIDGQIVKDRFGTDYAFINGESSKPISYMTLEEFEKIFTEDDIKTMQKNKVLTYSRRYFPIFRVDIYKKYGIFEER